MTPQSGEIGRAVLRSDLWSSLIDYAGVFPPAELPLSVALKSYERAVASSDGWIVGPCLIRSSQAEELGSRSPTNLGLVLDQALEQVPTSTSIAQVETRSERGAVAHAAAGSLQLGRVVYIESIDANDQSFLLEISRLRRAGQDIRAKIRTGGASALALPSVEQVASFIELCIVEAIPFKATAGLHHPVRRASEIENTKEHGFLNILAAVRAAIVGDSSACRGSLDSVDPEEFDVETAVWRGVGADVPEARVRKYFRSFGSCSFDEPVGHLRDLGVFPLEPAR